MASTNKTPNYELSQFVETDRPAWLTDYNGDMRTLDTALKAVSDVASGASGSISSLADRMTAAEGGITTNANDIDTLEARADALEAQAQSSAGTIAGIQTEQIAQNAGIEAVTQLAYNIARPYDAASTYEVGDYVIFQNTLYKCVTAVPVGEAFVPAKWLAIKVMDEVGGGGASAVIIPLTNDNTTFTVVGTPSYHKISNYYSGTYSDTPGTYNNPVLEIEGSSFIAQIGDLTILALQIYATNTVVQLNPKEMLIGDIAFKINAPVTIAPKFTSTLYYGNGQVNVGGANSFFERKSWIDAATSSDPELMTIRQQTFNATTQNINSTVRYKGLFIY